MQVNQRVKRMVFAAVIAAIYAALSLALAPLSFGQVQLRASEALTVLPLFSPCAVWGVTLGCLITNMVGLATGANVAGLVDVFVGTAATLAAALLTRALRRYRWRGLPLLATLPPVLLNAVAVGAELYFVLSPGAGLVVLLGFMGSVGLGQLGACTVLGLLLVKALEKTGAHRLLESL